MEGRREVDGDSVGKRGWEGERTWEGRGEGWKRRREGKGKEGGGNEGKGREEGKGEGRGREGRGREGGGREGRRRGTGTLKGGHLLARTSDLSSHTYVTAVLEALEIDFASLPILLPPLPLPSTPPPILPIPLPPLLHSH